MSGGERIVGRFVLLFLDRRERIQLPIERVSTQFAECGKDPVDAHSALEALATGRALITSDMPGCHETLRDAVAAKVFLCRCATRQRLHRHHGGPDRGTRPSADRESGRLELARTRFNVQQGRYLEVMGVA